VCTGRPLLALAKQIDEKPGLDFRFDFYIATTGAAIFDRDRNVIWSQYIPREVAEELYRRYHTKAGSSNPALVCAAEDYWIVSDQRPSFPYLSFARSFDEIPGPFAGYAMDTSTIERAQEVADDINTRFAGIVSAYVNMASVDVVPAGNSKGSGLARAAEHFGATLTAGIGDSFNDLELLDAADIAYTFRRSPVEMHTHADLLVDSVADAIHDFMCA
jgi:HAD superfamily hydrolase (TIGR01484 family)